MQQFLKLFNHPFPEEKNYKSYLIKIALISIFISVFLFVFRPFGLHQLEDALPKVCMGFGLITLLASILYDGISKKVFGFQPCGPKYSLGVWVIHTMGLILIIGICNYLYLTSIINIAIGGFGKLILATFAIGIFPLLFIGSLTVISGERKYQEIAKRIDPKAKQGSSQIKQIFGIDSDKIRYIEALQNYVRIWYEEGGLIKNKTERGTLTAIQNDIEQTSLKRCHRSYIVNAHYIEEAKGNAQGLQLTIQNVSPTIPVSRKYVASFR